MTNFIGSEILSVPVCESPALGLEREKVTGSGKELTLSLLCESLCDVLISKRD